MSRVVHRLVLLLSALFALTVCGCGAFSPFSVREEIPASVNAAPPPNPIVVEVDDREFVWNVIVDTVDDYFDIAQEDRVRVIGNVLTEGTILTHVQPGSSIFERWKKDSTPGFEQLQSTFQSIRRRAELRISPGTGVYSIHVTVYKELEDVDRPEQSPVGRQLERHDGSLAKLDSNPYSGPVQLGWIPIGRDTSLEQTIIADLQSRLQNIAPPEDVQLLPPIRRNSLELQHK
jgi:hypothetical protein